jgi:ParB-like chromosome segregation protein Spo0J
MTNRNRAATRFHVRWLPLDALIPDKRNARVHPARQVVRIADSIAAFGFNVPVLIDDKGGVLAGHGRVLAARRLGLKEVPTIALDHLSETQARAFMIADNRLGELASWDGARLGLELEELTSLDLDFSIEATGFELKEIDLRIGGAGDAVAPAAGDAVQSPSKEGRPSGRPMDRVRRDQRSRLEGRDQQSRAPVAQAGDAWALGPHRLICGENSDVAAFSAIDAAVRRWQAVTRESARLHPTGECFDEVARARRKPGEGAHA